MYLARRCNRNHVNMQSASLSTFIHKTGLLVQTRKRLHFWTNMWVQAKLTFAFRFRKPEVSELNPSLLNWLLPQARSLPLMQTKKVLSPPAQTCFTCCFPGKSTWNTLYSVLNMINNLIDLSDWHFRHLHIWRVPASLATAEFRSLLSIRCFSSLSLINPNRAKFYSKMKQYHKILIHQSVKENEYNWMQLHLYTGL